MKFKVGQEVTVGRTCGQIRERQSTEYYHGGNPKHVPLGAKGVIEEIYSQDKMYVRFENNDYGVQGGWFFHTKELNTVKEQAQAEKRWQENFDSFLEDSLEERLAEDTTIAAKKKSSREKAKKSFEPSFNTRDEFVAWVREEFPHLPEHAENGTEYKELYARKREIQKAAKEVWKWFAEATMSWGEDHCHNKYLRPIFEEVYQKNNIAAYSSSLHNLVLALELSGTIRFPYNTEAILLEQEIEGEK